MGTVSVQWLARSFATDKNTLLLYIMGLAASPLASRDFAPRGFIKLIFRVLDFKENFKKISAVSEILRYKQTDRHRATLYYR